MKGFGLAAALTAATLFASSVLADVDPIVIKGSKFFYKTNGTQFFIRGVAYQQDVGANGSIANSDNSFIDPLADPARCAQDIPLMKELQTNTIRVYAVDPSLDHSQCMQMLQDNDIYVVSDLSSPTISINRADPAWTDEVYQRYTSVIDMFANYTNVIGFFAGNEVANNNTNTDASAFVKAAVRDMKAYIKAKGYRQMGVGYATADVESIRVNLADYFNCGNPDDAIDFWGYNIYSWCGNSSYEESGYSDRTKQFSSYSVPAFFAEYGCNTVQPREFSEVQALFGPQMTPVWSGGIVYEYFQEVNNFGLVSVDGNTVSKLPDFTYLSEQMASITPSPVNAGSYNPSNSPQACPAVQTSSWEAKSSPLPPTPNSELCSCMMASLSCVVQPTLNESDYGKLFGTVCGYGSSCEGILAQPISGTYGAYSVCNATEQLSWAFNAYYLSQSSAAGACNFGGAAHVVSSASPSGTCASLLKQAGSAGTGVVTSSPTSGGGGSSSSTHKSAAPAMVPRSQFPFLPIALWMGLATALGASMVLL